MLEIELHKEEERGGRKSEERERERLKKKGRKREREGLRVFKIKKKPSG